MEFKIIWFMILFVLIILVSSLYVYEYQIFHWFSRWKGDDN